MPFQIIRNDITKVHVDAIVNTANPEPVYASGTDGAVYMAAGADQLLKERRRIGQLRTGEAIVTKAFRLPATYIIHTVGPSWWDGSHGEYEDLASCYRKSLYLAEQLADLDGGIWLSEGPRTGSGTERDLRFSLFQ